MLMQNKTYALKVLITRQYTSNMHANKNLVTIKNSKL